MVEDRFLWLGLGVFTFIAVKSIAHGLRQIVELTEVHNYLPIPLPQPPETNSLRSKEDTIKTDSLVTLATCNNIEIRRAATKILCDRFCDRYEAQSPAWNLLFRDLESEDRDPETFHRAQLALFLLADYDSLGRIGNPRRTAYSRWMALNGNAAARGAMARSLGIRDPEERELRRRRREAIVINEGDRPISQEDVFMRDGHGFLNHDPGFHRSGFS